MPLPHLISGSVDRVSCVYCQPNQGRDGGTQIENDVQIGPVFTDPDIGYVTCPLLVRPPQNTLIQQVEHVVIVSCYFIFVGLNSLDGAVTSRLLNIEMHINPLRELLALIELFAKPLFFQRSRTVWVYPCVSFLDPLI